MKTVSTFLTIICCVLMGCNNTETSLKPATYQSDSLLHLRYKKILSKARMFGNGSAISKPPLCIVFCDFTNSIDEVSKKKILHNAKDILEHYYKSHIVRFFPINSKEYAAPFYETIPFVAETVSRFTPSEKKTLENAIAWEKSNFDSMFQEVYISPRVKESCIIGTIPKAIREFGDYDPSFDTPLRLIYLSDMLENCNSQNGNINLEDGELFVDIQKLKTVQTALSFNGFKKLKIKIAVSTNKVMVRSDLLNEFWNTAFKNYGYQHEISLVQQLSLE